MLITLMLSVLSIMTIFVVGKLLGYGNQFIPYEGMDTGNYTQFEDDVEENYEDGYEDGDEDEDVDEDVEEDDYDSIENFSGSIHDSMDEILSMNNRAVKVMKLRDIKKLNLAKFTIPQLQKISHKLGHHEGLKNAILFKEIRKEIRKKINSEDVEEFTSINSSSLLKPSNSSNPSSLLNPSNSSNPSSLLNSSNSSNSSNSASLLNSSNSSVKSYDKNDSVYETIRKS
jgi:hypothetical protein